MSMALNELRESIRLRLSEKRFRHTVGVENCAVLLGKLLLPDKLEELRAAALLHDIAKELDTRSQLKLIDEFNIRLSDEDRATLPALHSFAAAPVISRDYPEYATEDILSAVSKHTLGAPKMSTFDKIIYISDFVEEGRAYSSCKSVREYLLPKIASATAHEERIAILNRAIVMSIDFTIDSLQEREIGVNSVTIKTKNSLLP